MSATQTSIPVCEIRPGQQMSITGTSQWRGSGDGSRPKGGRRPAEHEGWPVERFWRALGAERDRPSAAKPRWPPWKYEPQFTRTTRTGLGGQGRGGGQCLTPAMPAVGPIPSRGRADTGFVRSASSSGRSARWTVTKASVLCALVLLGASVWAQEPWTLADWLLRTDEDSLDWVCRQHWCEPDPPRLLYANGERVAFAGPLAVLVVSSP